MVILNACSKPALFWLIHKILIKHIEKQSRIPHPVAFVIGLLVLRRDCLPTNAVLNLKEYAVRQSIKHKLAEQAVSTGGIKLSSILYSCNFRWTVNWKYNWRTRRSSSYILAFAPHICFAGFFYNLLMSVLGLICSCPCWVNLLVFFFNLLMSVRQYYLKKYCDHSALY